MFLSYISAFFTRYFFFLSFLLGNLGKKQPPTMTTPVLFFPEGSLTLLARTLRRQKCLDFQRIAGHLQTWALKGSKGL